MTNNNSEQYQTDSGFRQLALELQQTNENLNKVIIKNQNSGEQQQDENSEEQVSVMREKLARVGQGIRSSLSTLTLGLTDSPLLSSGIDLLTNAFSTALTTGWALIRKLFSFLSSIFAPLFLSREKRIKQSNEHQEELQEDNLTLNQKLLDSVRELLDLFRKQSQPDYENRIENRRDDDSNAPTGSNSPDDSNNSSGSGLLALTGLGIATFLKKLGKGFLTVTGLSALGTWFATTIYPVLKDKIKNLFVGIGSKLRTILPKIGRLLPKLIPGIGTLIAAIFSSITAWFQNDTWKGKISGALAGIVDSFTTLLIEWPYNYIIKPLTEQLTGVSIPSIPDLKPYFKKFFGWFWTLFTNPSKALSQILPSTKTLNKIATSDWNPLHHIRNLFNWIADFFPSWKEIENTITSYIPDWLKSAFGYDTSAKNNKTVSPKKIEKNITELDKIPKETTLAPRGRHSESQDYQSYVNNVRNTLENIKSIKDKEKRQVLLQKLQTQLSQINPKASVNYQGINKQEINQLQNKVDHKVDQLKSQTQQDNKTKSNILEKENHPKSTPSGNDKTPPIVNQPTTNANTNNNVATNYNVKTGIDPTDPLLFLDISQNLKGMV